MGNPASVAHGPGLIGTFINIFLYGIMVTQCFMYFSRYQSDRMWMKVLVSVLLVTDTLNCVFDIWWIYDALIKHFADETALINSNWVFSTSPAIVGVVATIVQLFFAWRVKVLTNNWAAVTLIIVTALASVVGGVGSAIYIHYIPAFAEFQRFRAIVIVWLISAVICDCTVTAALTWHLRKHKTGFSNTDDILNRIIRLTVQNGLLTAVWAMIDLITFLATPTGLHLLFNIPLAKLYTNSLMSSLNSRTGWRYQSTETDRKSQNIELGSRRPDLLNLSTVTRPEVFISVESHQMVDVNDSDKADIEWSQTSSNHAPSVKQPVEAM
ncbi:hypothetical protein BDY19DRAFT_87392 [Irpex rosettiformis]|uniref:Uncharacterized protein n=1 Tax=Irpex rosettiformis TaxID=378272 RepID=A0ACB8U673_9APHY|nr:hypothetical protein BDY19DRAFT_87392 [Irpex rosettiformis]